MELTRVSGGLPALGLLTGAPVHLKGNTASWGSCCSGPAPVVKGASEAPPSQKHKSHGSSQRAKSDETVRT